MQFVIQREYANSPESRAVYQACLLQGGEICSHHVVDRCVVPVGSVEYVREYMASLGIMIPAPLDYPSLLRKWLFRDIRKGLLKTAPRGSFVKPILSKNFEAICQFDPLKNYHIKSQYSSQSLCWISDPVRFVCEYRGYILDQEILGISRYDDGPSNPLFTTQVANGIMAMKDAYTNAPAAYAIDAGRLDTGEVALVEVNDFWATGYYREGMSAVLYAKWLDSGWNSLCKNAW